MRIRKTRQDTEGPAEAPRNIHEPESALLWLARRKEPGGTPMIGPSAFAAGQRLGSDLAFAGMLPRTTMSWSGQPGSGGLRGSAGLNPTEAMLSARQRAQMALSAVGPELSGLLIDICGFGKGLEAIERERRWPPRSGKVVARLALSTLARHYGLSDVAIGRSAGRARRWAEPDARPAVTASHYRAPAAEASPADAGPHG